MKKKQNPYPNIKLQKKYKKLKMAFIITFSLLILTLYQNFDYQLFKFMITKNYIFTQSLDKIYNETLGENNYISYSKNFDEMIMTLFTEKLRSTSNDKYTYLYNPKQYKDSKEETKKDALNGLKTSELNSITLYLNLPNISSHSKRYIYNNKNLLGDYKNIVLDLRENGGGDLNYLYKIEDLFFDQGTTLGYEKTRIPIFTKKVKSKGTKYLYFDNIIILQSKHTASAAEGFIMALKENYKNVTTIGTNTFGKGIGQIVLPLTSGYHLKTTILQVDTPKENNIHEIGIPPDIFYEKEDIIDFTLHHLLENKL